MNRTVLELTVKNVAGEGSCSYTHQVELSGMPASDIFLRSVADLAIWDGTPPPALEVERAYFIPPHHCLYDATGARIEESCLRRGAGGCEVVGDPPARIAIPDECYIIESRVHFLGPLTEHWGHFLTESISRLWPRLDSVEYLQMSAFHTESKLPYVGERTASFLACFNLESGRNLQTSDRPVCLARCVIPRPSFAIRNEAFTVHKRVFEQVARFVLPAELEPSTDVAYLSRSNYTSDFRVMEGEEDVIALMRSMDAEIVSPEALTLRDQVMLFNKHHAFVGCWGSAFHNVGFALNAADVSTILLMHDVPNINFLMFDAINRNASHYVKCADFTVYSDNRRPLFKLDASILQGIHLNETPVSNPCRPSEG